jgi:sugar (pentulose or hexulose) kinase
MDNAAPGVTVAGSDAEAPLILTLDIGSSSTRAALYDRLARRVAGAEAAAPNAFVTGSEGLVEADPITLLATAAECIDAVLAQAGALAQQIAAVAVDTFVSNILPVDAAGEPLAPLVTYADTRNAEDADALRRDLDERAVHDRTGCLLRTSYWPPRLAWFRRTQPELWRRVARWLTLGELLELHWLGRCRVSLSVASWSGLLDRRTLVWDDAVARSARRRRRSTFAAGGHRRTVDRAARTVRQPLARPARHSLVARGGRRRGGQHRQRLHRPPAYGADPGHDRSAARGADDGG